jgi:hypothetical protein
VTEFIDRLPGVASVADAAFGVVLGSNVPPTEITNIRGLAESSGGAASFWKSTSSGWRLIDASTNDGERQIIDRLKAAFDPDGTLQPLPWQIR